MACRESIPHAFPAKSRERTESSNPAKGELKNEAAGTWIDVADDPPGHEPTTVVYSNSVTTPGLESTG